MNTDEIRSKLARDRFASEALGARIESAGEGHAVAVADITDAMKNAEGSVMGGVLFTLADFAFAFRAQPMQIMDHSEQFRCALLRHTIPPYHLTNANT